MAFVAFVKKRSFLFGAAYYLAVSLSIIWFSSPLFRVLGFEYSGLIALFTSLHLLYYASNFAAERKDESVWSILKSLSGGAFLLCSIPLLVSIASVLFIENCSLWDGIMFYIEIVNPTALIAMLCGIRFGILPRSKKKTNIYLAIFWAATIIISLLPGYLAAKIYTYGWQYGYFPGFVWDEAMELSKGYWMSRTLQMVIILLWIIYDIDKTKREQYRFADAIKLLINWQLWLAIVAGSFLGILANSYLSDDEMKSYLSAKISASSAIIHFKYGTLTTDEITLIKFNTKKYIEEIDSVYGIKSLPGLDIYMFPTSEELYQFVGTREASISKPWKRSVYITKQNLHSLKHEMAHIMLASYGSFPFDISWSTGLTEGAAVAIEDDYDGIRAVDEYSARMLQLKLADGVQQVMQPSGFLSAAPSQSYVLAGSFSKYLIQKHGAEKFLKVYRERDFETVYNKPLSEFDREWKKTLMTEFETPMNYYDSLRMNYYFMRTSIVQQPCIRRIGKLLKKADEEFKNRNYKLADSIYEIVVNESGRGRAIQGRVQSLLHLKNFQGALEVLDTTTAAQEIKNKAALHLLRGDVIAMTTGDLRKASDEWEEAIKLELGDSYFISAFTHRYFFGSAKNVPAVQKALSDIYSIEPEGNKYDLLYSIEPSDSNDYAFTVSRLYMYSSYLYRTGALSKAYTIWKNGREKIANIIPDTSVVSLQLFEKLAEQKYLHYQEIFKEVH